MHDKLLISVMAQSKIFVGSCLSVVLLHLLERLFVQSDVITYLAISIESLIAVFMGYSVIWLDSNGTLLRCAVFGAVIGVVKFVLVLPEVILQWGDEAMYTKGIAGFFLFSAVAIAYYALLGLFGGGLRRLWTRRKWR